MLKNAFILSITTGFLAACGGGGGGGSSAPAPQSNNRAPTVVIAIADAVNEGETFEIDASGSTDPDAGDTLTFTISQTAGSTAVQNTISTGLFEFTANRVPSDETLTFQVSVSDGTATSSRSVSIDVRDVPAEPRFRMIFDPASDLSVDLGGETFEPNAIYSLQLSGESQFGVMIERPDPNGVLRDVLLFLEPTGATYAVRQSSFFELFVSMYDFLVIDDIFGSVDDDFAIVLADTGEVILFGRNPSPSRGGRIDNFSNQSVSDPCTIAFSDIYPTSNGIDMVVGKRSGGVEFFRNEIDEDIGVFIGRGTYTSERDLQFGSEVCIVFESQPPVSSGRAQPDLIAIDTQSGEIATIINGGSSLSIASGQDGALDIQAGQQLVAWEPFQERDASGLQAVALYSDGEYSGNHSVLIVSRTIQGEIIVESKTWQEGAPVDLAIGDANEDGDVDIVIVSEQNGDAVVFAQSGMQANAVPQFADAAFFETGIGASGIAALPQGALAGDFYVTFRDSRLIRTFTAN